MWGSGSSEVTVTQALSGARRRSPTLSPSAEGRVHWDARLRQGEKGANLLTRDSHLGRSALSVGSADVLAHNTLPPYRELNDWRADLF